MQTKLDKAQSNAVKWESKWTHIQNTAAKKTLLLGRIKIATHNLYQVSHFFLFLWVTCSFSWFVSTPADRLTRQTTQWCSWSESKHSFKISRKSRTRSGAKKPNSVKKKKRIRKNRNSLLTAPFSLFTLLYLQNIFLYQTRHRGSSRVLK